MNFIVYIFSKNSSFCCGLQDLQTAVCNHFPVFSRVLVWLRAKSMPEPSAIFSVLVPNSWPGLGSNALAFFAANQQFGAVLQHSYQRDFGPFNVSEGEI